MKPFDVYPLYPITPVRGSGSTLWDANGQTYLDMYGGHAVISIGHSHPHYVQRLTEQLQQLGFYSNSVQIPQQQAFAQHLGKLANLPNYDLFLVNSGAEANENALKLASFHTGRTKVVACRQAFHGRTSGAVAVTDNPKIQAPINFTHHVQYVPLNDVAALQAAVDDTTCAVIVEGIQGVGGIQVASDAFLHAIRGACDATEAVFIHDSVQCGYGRSGRFFSFQHTDVIPDLITVAKGMGNGFPIGGLLISPKFKASHGLLGTTFGGNHLACVAAHAVLEVIEQENLIPHAAQLGESLSHELQQINGIKEVRGRGLMIGIELEQPMAAVRDALLYKHHIFVGTAGTHTLRLLPSLALTPTDAEQFLSSFKEVMNK